MGSSFRIRGGAKLKGEVDSIGNKNLILKLIPAALLSSEPVTLRNVPAISDVRVMLSIMKSLGTKVKYKNKGETLVLHTPEISSHEIDGELASKLRASNMFIGPLLARKGKVRGVFPGGDKIGPREMNAHFDGLAQLGASCRLLEDGFEISGKLKATNVFLFEPSVTATENVILASVFIKGRTTIENAASEPHVEALCEMLNSMGAKITGGGTNRIVVEGVDSFSSTEFVVSPDYIYIGTMIAIAAATSGELLIKNVVKRDLRSIIYFFEKLGVRVEFKGSDLFVPSGQYMRVEDKVWARTKGVYCQPWPCFPSDLMSPTIALATQVEGSILFFEKMYPGRMFFANFLNGMGANILLADPYRIIVNGKTPLYGRRLFAPDLRAGVAFVMAGLIAEGDTIVEGIDHVDRGYPKLEEVLSSIGADISRI